MAPTTTSKSNGSVVEVEAERSPELPEHSPTILNASNHSMVVFQERGAFYNCQVLRPGEAVSMTVRQTGGFPLVPYRVHAVVGEENNLPSSRDSTTNLIKVTAVPAAFIAGCFATAISAGMLVGPSVALAPLVSGLVVKGVVIDSTAIAAGAVMSTRAHVVSDMILKDRPNGVFNKTERLRPGRRYLVVTGGLDDGSVNIDEVKRKEFEKKYVVNVWKTPLSNKALKKSGVLVDDGKEDEAGLVNHGEGDEVELIMEAEMPNPKPGATKEKRGWFKK